MADSGTSLETSLFFGLFLSALSQIWGFQFGYGPDQEAALLGCVRDKQELTT